MTHFPAGPLGPQTHLSVLYESRYIPAKNPDPTKQTTREQYRTAIRNFAKPREFADWLASTTTAAKTGKTAAELYAAFERTRKRREWLPKWEPTVGDLCDANVEAAMHFTVEVAGAAKTTANKLRRHINALWNFANEIELVSTTPRNRAYKVPKKDRIALFPEQVDDLIAAAERMDGEAIGGVPASQWYSGLVLFMYSTGLRISAAIGVPTANLDLDRGEILAPAYVQKQGADQRLSLFPSCVEILRAWRLAERGVPTVLGDWPYKVAPLRKRWKQLLVAAGIFQRVQDVPRDCCFHMMRRTLASHLYPLIGLDGVRRVLGHSSPDVTDLYIDSRVKVAPRVPDILSDPRPVIPLSDPTPPAPPPEPPTPRLQIYRGEAG
jgi:integrase